MTRATVRAGALALLVAAGAVANPSSARADEPVAGPGWALAPTSTQLHLLPFGEPTGDRALDPAIALLPMRLSLLNEAFPIAPALPGDPCQASEEAGGNTAGGFPAQKQVYLALTQSLVLHGFARFGCPLDAGVGGALTYSIPLPKDLWLVLSAGTYAQPNVVRGQTTLRSDARVDLLLRKTPDSALSLGVGRRGVALTGLW